MQIHLNGISQGDRRESALTKTNAPSGFVFLLCCLAWLMTSLAATPAANAATTLRPPAVPLVACDPYFSIWSCADKLTDVATTHWTGHAHQLTSLVRIDGKAFRVMGKEPAATPALPQVDLQVLPTRTIYKFAGQGIQLTLTFMTPALPEDLDLLARPVTYLTWDVAATDGAQHAVSLYYDNTAEPVVDEVAQAVVWSEEKIGDLVASKFGSKDQPVLQKRGDDRRIDWGYLYAAAPRSAVSGAVIAPVACRDAFVANGAIPAEMDKAMPRAVKENAPVAAFTFDLGQVGAKVVSRWMILAYDDLYSMQYFGKNLRPYWRRNGWDAARLLKASAREYVSLQKRCAAFDEELLADLRKCGGEKYAQMCALTYRQCLAGNKLAADAKGRPLLFPKENTSNGCVGTVDVIFPMAPQFLFFGPSLTKAMIISNFDYANSPRWKWPFAPHDLGCYPHADQQVYGGGERTEDNQMPVEETGNMIILMTALAQMEGNADFAAGYWPVLQKWAEYLKAKGFDPENQLCTDDFAGHLAHNVNLSGKAIVALGAFGKLCQMRSEAVGGALKQELQTTARQYHDMAGQFAARWVKEADDGDHFRLAFDKPGSWSQKYNLVWDRILGLNLFPAGALQKDMEYYKKIMNPYGVSLDSRQPYAKVDWTLWTATLTGSQADFEAISNPAWQYINDTPNRVPVSDLYWTKNSAEVGMHARPVVGAFFIKALYDRELWNKWARRDRTKAAHWAPFPKPVQVTTVLPTSEHEAATWFYTTEKPGEGWFAPGFDTSSWSSGAAGFGTTGTPGAIVRTEWKTSDIWLRREFSMSSVKWKNLQLRAHHDEDIEVYLNGVLVATAEGYTSGYGELPLNVKSSGVLKAGKNVIAVHCKQTVGGQYVDVGLVSATEK